MGWFSRKPKPYDGLVDSLVNRPWEWRYWTGKSRAGNAIDGYMHATGVVVTEFGALPGALVGSGNRVLQDALLAHTAARVNCGKLFDFDSTARMLAEAVLKGDKTAAVALADRVKELV